MKRAMYILAGASFLFAGMSGWIFLIEKTMDVSGEWCIWISPVVIGIAGAVFGSALYEDHRS